LGCLPEMLPEGSYAHPDDRSLLRQMTETRS